MISTSVFRSNELSMLKSEETPWRPRDTKFMPCALRLTTIGREQAAPLQLPINSSLFVNGPSDAIPKVGVTWTMGMLSICSPRPWLPSHPGVRSRPACPSGSAVDRIADDPVRRSRFSAPRFPLCNARILDRPSNGRMSSAQQLECMVEGTAIMQELEVAFAPI